jgi:hypothetical protein
MIRNAPDAREQQNAGSALLHSHLRCLAPAGRFRERGVDACSRASAANMQLSKDVTVGARRSRFNSPTDKAPSIQSVARPWTTDHAVRISGCESRAGAAPSAFDQSEHRLDGIGRAVKPENKHCLDEVRWRSARFGDESCGAMNASRSISG